MATTIDVTVALGAGIFFNLNSFNSALQISTNAPNATIFIIPFTGLVTGQQVATVNNAPLNPPPGVTAGSQTFSFEIPGGAVTPFPSNGQQVGLVNINFDSTPASTINGIPLIYDASTGVIRAGPVTLTIRCIHGSSLIEMEGGTQKRIDQIKKGEFVLSDGKYVKVLDVPTCWLTFQNVDHDAVIFEPNSLGDNFPHKRFIIDPGHPMCTPKEYEEKGLDALRPAGQLYEELSATHGAKVYIKKWTDPIIQEDPSRRYDLILEEPYNTYTANGIIVQTYGYKDHRYKNFV